ncbi:MAG: hypothetical protein J6J86_03580, partial [Lachnospiraceae bacterium]|nr:hypothetical protein [Lachnospiraceae bacterium]
MKKKLIQVAVVLVLIAIIAGSAVINMLMEHYRPTTERMDLYTYFNIEETNTEDVLLFLQDGDLIPTLTDTVLKRFGDELYISYDMV